MSVAETVYRHGIRPRVRSMPCLTGVSAATPGVIERGGRQAPRRRLI
jgi:hypothetical protein